MNIELFLILLTIMSTFTSLMTEYVKKMLDESGKTYSCNILVSIISVITVIVSMVLFYIIKQVPFTIINVIYIFAMVIANTVGSTVGYDKVKQTIEQLNKLK